MRAVSMVVTQSRATSFSCSDRGRPISVVWADTRSSVSWPESCSQVHSPFSGAKSTVSAAAFHQKAHTRTARESMGWYTAVAAGIRVTPARKRRVAKAGSGASVRRRKANPSSSQRRRLSFSVTSGKTITVWLALYWPSRQPPPSTRERAAAMS